MDATPEEIRAALRAVDDACFDCGDWRSDDSDESYADVLARSAAAERYLLALLDVPEDAPGSETVHSPADLVRQACVHLRLAREALEAAEAPRVGIEACRVAAAVADLLADEGAE